MATDNKSTDLEEIRRWLVERIQHFVPHLGAKGQITDKYLKHKIFALVEALAGIDSFDDVEQYSKYLLRMYRSHKGGADVLHELLRELDVKHRYP